jgi:potassium channel LctB
MVKKRIKDYSKERIKELHGVAKLLFNKPILKFIGLIIFYFIINSIANSVPKNFPIRIIVDIIGILIFIYFVAVLIFIIQRTVRHMFNPKNIFTLIFTYALFILGLILLFSTFYSLAEISGTGYLKYGNCTGNFNPSMISTDSGLSREFFYFSAVTYFTVGYGDICPMGFAKIISIFNAFVGNIVAVIIVAIIINNYVRRKNES